MESRRRAQLRFLAELGTVELPLFLMGGFAEDALLGRKITWERAAIDFLIEDASWESVRVQLEALGIASFEPRFTGPSGEPLAFVSHESELKVEVWVCERIGESYANVLPGTEPADGTPGFFRLLLSIDTFLYPATTLEDVTVQTILPLAARMFRAASAQPRGDAQSRREDLEMVERLSKALRIGCEAVETVTQITKLG